METSLIKSVNSWYKSRYCSALICMLANNKLQNQDTIYMFDLDVKDFQH